jgi:hypothetical protein
LMCVCLKASPCLPGIILVPAFGTQILHFHTHICSYFCTFSVLGNTTLSAGLWDHPLCLFLWTQPFVCDFFLFLRWGSHGTIFVGWLWTLILLISASLVARITGVSYRRRQSYFSW